MAVTADSFGPFDGTPAYEDQWRAMQRRISVSGVVRNQANELSTFGDSSGRQVKVSPGEAWVEGHWGQIATEKTCTVTANATGSTRLDLAIFRMDFANNTAEVDVLAGTTSPPALTRNSSRWEIPLALISVANGAATIAAADVKDARQWGGPPVATVTDDFTWYGDRISSCSRFAVNTDNAVTNGFLYLARMHSLGEQTVQQVRLCPTVLPVAGTTTVRIFRGFRQDRLTSFVDPTTSTFMYASGGAAATVHWSAIPATTFRAGETIVVAVLGLGTSTAATLATNSVVFTSGANPAAFLNPDTSNVMTTLLKGSVASMPTTLNLLDGSWSLRDRVFWSALA